MKEEGRTAWGHPGLSLLIHYITTHYARQGQPDNLLGKRVVLHGNSSQQEDKGKEKLR